jgi:exopolysaccharide biosynthesis operon protein EpsL
MGHILPTPTKTKRITHHAVIIGGVCLLMSPKVWSAALFDHIVQPYVATQLIYDSNVLRLPNNFDPSISGNKTTKSSFIKQIKAGLAAKWQISQQQIEIDLSINQNWYSTFTELNYTGHDLLAQWNWQLGQRLKGELTYINILQLSNFQQINKLIGNLQNQERYVANGAYQLLPDWYLRAGFIRSSNRFPAPERQQSNLLENSSVFGIRYLNAIDNMLDFRITLTDGKYPNRDAASVFDNAYTRINYDVSGIWNYSAKTQVKAQLGYVSQNFQHIKSRNFASMTAKADILWQVSDKSSLWLEAWREVSSAGNITTSFLQYQGVRLTPTWTWTKTPKIQVELPISYEQQTPLGATGISSDSANAAQQATLSIIRLNLNYTPIPTIEMSTFALYERRRSNDPTSDYQDQSVGFTMKVSF